ncbi:MAG: DUF5329 domain-containing protein [Dechloromonas sp.]|nr:DUF5329 domain-containing protein [Dechloromonas sp.]
MARSIVASIALAASALLFVAPAAADPIAPSIRAEIDALLADLEASACEFNRNGSWYSAREARAHLRRKLDYLEKKNAIAQTEQFIELGASTSSFSGKPYLVKCADADPVASSQWLSTQLKIIRSVQPALPDGNR